jgi:heme exporter protein CcmD
MTHASFVTAAFAITAIATLWIIATSLLAMRRSEALAEDLRAQDRPERS